MLRPPLRMTKNGANVCIECGAILILDPTPKENWQRYLCSLRCKEEYYLKIVQAGERAMARKRLRQCESYKGKKGDR